ncbi:MAG: CrcB family protein [Parachlamydiales bacterium]|nr:CrcB family protein [Parachlamydiales bacterium]
MNTGYLFVGLGGALGAILRVALSRFLPSFILNIPLKILCINVLGCFILGILTQILALHWQTSINMRHFLIQGFLGGFTTFSAFALEFGLLYEKGSYISAIIYATLSVVFSIIFFFGGLKIIKIFA